MFMNIAHNLLHFALIEYSARIVHIFFFILTTHPLAFHPTHKHESKRFNSNFLAHKFIRTLIYWWKFGRKCVCNFRWNSIFRTQTSYLLGYFILFYVRCTQEIWEKSQCAWLYEIELQPKIAWNLCAIFQVPF